MKNMQQAIMKNWAVATIMEINPYSPPELIKYKLMGNVYKHPNHTDGTFVTTSSIQDIVDCGGYKIVKTRNTEYKIYPQDVDVNYENVYNNAFEKLSINKD